MASPVLESFCCYFNKLPIRIHGGGNSSGSSDTDIKHVYNVFCTLFSSIGLISAIYQLWPKHPSVPLRTHRETHLFLRQNAIITWLTIADLLAALGILIRSVLWLSSAIRIENKWLDINSNMTMDNDFSHIFCAINAGWFQYFYISTYMWTFCYALDVYLYVTGRKGLPVLYQVLGWLVSLVLAVSGLISLYYPSLLQCASDLHHLLPHYLSSYIPIVFVMIANPLLFYCSTKKVQESLRSMGTYTDQERETVRRVQRKFFLLTVAFYVCWTPNILNGILLGFKYRYNDMGDGVESIFLTLWIIMAVLNPIQALFNAILYRKVGGAYCYTSRHLQVTSDTDAIQDFSASLEYNNDTSSLLSFNRG